MVYCLFNFDINEFLFDDIEKYPPKYATKKKNTIGINTITEKNKTNAFKIKNMETP
jgi:hypothetical protein